MREWIIRCDKCKEEIKGNPIMLSAERVLRDDPDVSVEVMQSGTELCDKCYQGICDEIIGTWNAAVAAPEAAPDEEPVPEPEEAKEQPKPDPQEEKSKGCPRVKLDHGKIRALHNAGWKYRDIADEMGCTMSQVSNSLQRYKGGEE